MITNAMRFINAYNKIDYAIRVQHGFKRSLSFADMIRKAVPMNYIVRKYEEELIDYGRLRNAIIHKSNEEYVIAEPHENVVNDIEKIAKIITTPPKAINSIANTDVLCVLGQDTIKSVIEIMYSTKYSNIPVYTDNTLVGIANGQRILDAIGKVILEGKDLDDYINLTKIESIINPEYLHKYYDVLPVTATIEEVLNLYYRNRKLQVVIFTKTGTNKESPLGIVTSSDVLEMNSILENY